MKIKPMILGLVAAVFVLTGVVHFTAEGDKITYAPAPVVETVPAPVAKVVCPTTAPVVMSAPAPAKQVLHRRRS
jgi:hypothetical protein